MKLLDQIFRKFWWSLHPLEVAYMQRTLIEARLEYPRQATRFLCELINRTQPQEAAEPQVRELKRKLREMESKAYGVPEITALPLKVEGTR